MLERIQKILSARGIASRRKAEEYILQGLVRVNGKPAILGQKADPDVDQIEVDGKVLEARREMLYYVMYKPVGVETSNVDSFTRLLVDSNVNKGAKVSSANKRINESTLRSDSGQAHKRVQTVRDLLPPALQGKIYPVGRLDKDSEGLLLMTNDGVLAYRLTHPKFDHEKEYEVMLEEPIFDGALRKLENGMMLSGEKTKPAHIRRLGPKTFRIALTEGKNRQIRRMVQKVGSTVKTLKRVRIMTLEDQSLQSGKLRLLTDAEKTALLAAVGV